MSPLERQRVQFLIKCIRAIYAFVDRVKESGLHETVTTNVCNLRLPTVSPSSTGEPGLHDVRPRCSPRPQLPRTTGSTRRSSRRLQALSPKSASPSAAPVPVSQHIKTTRHLDHTRATPPTTPRQPATPRQQAYPVTPSPHHASLVTELETAKQQIKAELKLHVKVNFDQLTNTMMSLTHYTNSLTATAEEYPNSVMSEPLRHPSVAGTEHIDTLSAGGLRQRRSPAMELSRHVDVSVHTGPQPTLPSTHSKPASSCTPIAPVTGGGGGGCSGDSCVTQAGSVF